MHGLSISSTSSSSDGPPPPLQSFASEFVWAVANALIRPLQRVKRIAWKYSFLSLEGVLEIADDDVIIPSQAKT